jgi:hypothetical protein
LRLDGKRPGTSTTFIDAASGEDIFQVASDAQGQLLMAFRLYDANGTLVAASKGLAHYPDGVTVRCNGGELLLDVPADATTNVRYCLYNCDGALLTISDGARTKIYPLLRVEGVARDWAPAAPDAAVEAPARRAGLL